MLNAAHNPQVLALGLSTTDSWLIGLVVLATLLAFGYLSARLGDRDAGRPKRPGKPRPARPPHPTPPRASPPADATDESSPQTLAERRAWACERVVHWWVLANRVHGTAMDDAPTVQFSPRLRHALGLAYSGRNLIRISDWHLMNKPIRVADETVAHEVAHIFADRHYGMPCRHGRLWKQTMVAMGQKPDVTYKDIPQEEPEPSVPTA